LLTLSDLPRGYRRDLARAPDAAPTGKTSERVKERSWFYHAHFYRQSNSPSFNLSFINQVQTVHRRMLQKLCSEPRARRNRQSLCGIFAVLSASEPLFSGFVGSIPIVQNLILTA